MAEGVVVVSGARLDPAELRRLVDLFFEDMVKCVVDVSRGVAAVGGEMHADAEVLLEGGSRQADLWGANYYPGRGREGSIQDPAVRERVRERTFALVGEGEALP